MVSNSKQILTQHDYGLEQGFEFKGRIIPYKGTETRYSIQNENNIIQQRDNRTVSENQQQASGEEEGFWHSEDGRGSLAWSIRHPIISGKRQQQAASRWLWLEACGRRWAWGQSVHACLNSARTIDKGPFPLNRGQKYRRNANKQTIVSSFVFYRCLHCQNKTYTVLGHLAHDLLAQNVFSVPSCSFCAIYIHHIPSDCSMVHHTFIQKSQIPEHSIEE